MYTDYSTAMLLLLLLLLLLPSFYSLARRTSSKTQVQR
jgi:hypothetical protein